MKYGFIIDNRKCIGCHACTVACKSEHDVPIGVNRTWVKQTEKGEFPNTRRVFSVLRCNHCTDAPCVDICPVQALYTREDGIVDFDNNRCIGCKSCMQACPYDALYIDPETHTAAKCNYCAHRIDIGLEPACVNVCPEHAIVSGDMDNPNTEISQLLAREQMVVRKAEKNTKPNLFYINGDEASLNPSVTERSDNYMWNSQHSGVGHFAKFAEALASGKDLVEMARKNSSGNKTALSYEPEGGAQKSVTHLMEKANPKRVYDTPDKGILWGWEVSAYVWTKAISAGAVLVPFIAFLLGFELNETIQWTSAILGIVFLTLTGALLVKDLDQPKRFLYVLLRPQWKSWLVKGGYAITIFGGLLSVWMLALWMEWSALIPIVLWATAAIGVVVAVYTAFLFAQAKGRDFWQSPALALHMIIHSLMAGAASFLLLSLGMDELAGITSIAQIILLSGIALNLVVLTAELMTTHPTEDAHKAAKMILTGRFSTVFWSVCIVLGNLIPIALLLAGSPIFAALSGIPVLIGIYYAEKIWVEAPQRIPLT